MRGKSIIVLFLLTGVISYCFGQNREDSFFKNGDKVNFIGNSITHSGDFHHYILMYYATRFPNQKVAFYNCGIKGDNANSFLRRMDADILPRKANWSVVMAGMNDVNRSLYAPALQSQPETEERKRRALSDYEGYLESVIQRLQKSKTKIILQKPSIYDQTGDLPAPNLVGVNDALKKCTQIIDGLAKKYKLQVIDYYTIMNDLNTRLQIKDPKATIIGNDRVHPGPVGNMIMAYQFLKSTNAPKYVSLVEIENGALKHFENCALSDLNVSKDNIGFKLKEQSLPFPVPAEAEQALSLVPFAEELNVQLLKVNALAEGKYTLTIDGVFIGNFTSQQLANGLNIAGIKSTPQYKQALKVMQQAIQYRNVQRKLRDLKFIEFSYLPEKLWNADFTEIKKFSENYLAFLQSANDARYPAMKTQFDAYLDKKPEEKELEQQAIALPDSIFAASKLTEHTYQISKADLAMPDRNVAPFGTNASGAEFAPHTSPGIYNKNYTYPTVVQLDYFKSKGLTLFRMPFLWERIQNELGGELNKDELSRMMAFVDAARERNLWVILDMHNYGRRHINGNNELIGSPLVSIDHVADAWAKIVREFKSKENIWAYGIMNEPHDMLPATPWFQIAQSIITKIRSVDSKTPIMVGGDSWSSAERWPLFSDNLKNLVDPSNNLIFESHIYFDKDASGAYKRSYDEEGTTPSTGITRAEPFVKWLKMNKLRGFVGEYGVPDDDPRWLVTLDNFLNYLKSNCIGGAYWSAGPWWHKYKLAIEPVNGIDRPQMPVLVKYQTADSGCK
ncbi:aryl-phospho-beta-D-glucosidase BglC (GH1 family) [Arcticibacter tournemirensis]|uniref:Cellulase family glycosylhydrolase n=1 Tax=Arcticibacter tournemirensis TaxID=699437 RepID=A0A5M9HH21_9SPHI|nr:cellulase family glycosylhydrolase [Arcticibacter tournemirensis]KAA8484724.1 cellulase family glycosylhydrolase [Arcticibacter tournemirensis]TQM46977.1 aryl-phospho-beta-D-glucosidase BglC (GH1 family) [Arcticibacter tournemirensis]